MIKASQFSAVVAAETVLSFSVNGETWPETILVLARDGLSEVAIAVELAYTGSPTFAALTAVPTTGAYLLPKVAGYQWEIFLPSPAASDQLNMSIKVHLFGTATSTNVGVILE